MSRGKENKLKILICVQVVNVLFDKQLGRRSDDFLRGGSRGKTKFGIETTQKKQFS